MKQSGTSENPLRVAIIGSGPSGFYAAEHLKKQDMTVEIDMFDRLPTPFGLVRGGVAPDHPKIKSVTKVYDRLAMKPGFRFFGHVEFGKDITHADLTERYHAIIYAVGAQTDRRLGIAGEDLPGSHPATEFVGWYNAHPDFRNHQFDLSQQAVAVIGVGNVAMDVARILGRTEDELKETDIANYALEALAHSKIKTIHVLGRRGPAQAAFTPPEIKELGEMQDVDVIVSPEDMALDELSQHDLDQNGDRNTKKNIETLTLYSQQSPSGKPKQIIFHFLTSPIEIIGNDRVEAIKVVKNELYIDEHSGKLRPRPTDKIQVLPVGLVFRSVGYHGVALPDVPFYGKWGIIPNENGRVLVEFGAEQIVRGEYVVGWIKRGPSGIIGTNKPDSVETVNMLLEDLQTGNLLTPENPTENIVNLFEQRQIRFVTYEDWQLLDEIEQKRGAEEGRPRQKLSSVKEMLDILKTRKPTQPTGD